MMLDISSITLLLIPFLLLDQLKLMLSLIITYRSIFAECSIMMEVEFHIVWLLYVVIGIHIFEILNSIKYFQIN